MGLWGRDGKWSKNISRLKIHTMQKTLATGLVTLSPGFVTASMGVMCILRMAKNQNNNYETEYGHGTARTYLLFMGKAKKYKWEML